jgi:hypothetical protein
MAISIGFVRKEMVSVSIKLVDSSLTEQQVLEGLTTGQYEIFESSREVVDIQSGNVIGNVIDWEPEDLTHGDFELLKE